MILIVCAFLPEARPLIERFKLKYSSENSPFPLYQNAHLKLIISGPGKIASAAATSHLFTLFSSARPKSAFNFGLAGHASHEVGEGFIGHQIREFSTNQALYPSLIFDLPCQTATISTVDTPESLYPEDCLYEMEAYGFYQTALRFSTCELIHVYKVVSDNSKAPLCSFNPKNARALIEKNLSTIEQILNALIILEKKIPHLDLTNHEEFQECLRRWNFSQTEKLQLQRIYQRWSLCYAEPLLDESIDSSLCGTQILAYLKNKLGEKDVPKPYS